MTRGEIRWYRFKPPDKKRPVLIISRDCAIEYLREITVAPITSTIRDIPSEAYLSRSEGMPKDCAANFDHIQTVPKDKIGSLITRLSPERLEAVSKAIAFALEL